MKKIKKTDRSVMTYEQAVALVALNDGDGDAERLLLRHVSGVVSVGLMADVFGVTPEQFGRAVIKFRRTRGKKTAA